MTRQGSFKRRVRERMASTGERYNAARRVLIEQSTDRSADGRPRSAADGGSRTWKADPGMSDDALRDATGRGWDEWCDVLDTWPANDGDHGAIATYLVEEHGVEGWWAQTVTVGYERITGLRLPFQGPDGTFSANKSRTVKVDAATLREMLLDTEDRKELFPGMVTELRSRPTSKNVRLAVGPGTAEVSLEPRDDGKVKVTIQHARLPAYADVQPWKDYWSAWLEAIDER